MNHSMRERALADIPSYYNPWLHLAMTTGVGVVTLLVVCLFIHEIRLTELLIVPGIFVLSNAFEWYAHKYYLHRRRWPLYVLYDRHTPIHHVVYEHDRMSIQE